MRPRPQVATLRPPELLLLSRLALWKRLQEEMAHEVGGQWGDAEATSKLPSSLCVFMMYEQGRSGLFSLRTGHR